MSVNSPHLVLFSWEDTNYSRFKIFLSSHDKLWMMIIFNKNLRSIVEMLNLHKHQYYRNMYECAHRYYALLLKSVIKILWNHCEQNGSTK